MDPKKAFLLRISPELWRQVEAWAQEELRSVNGQIEFVLRQAVAQRNRRPARNAPGAAPAGDGPEKTGG